MAYVDKPYQERVKIWCLECFGQEILNDKLERVFRFIEEALELGQSLGLTKEQTDALVNYVFNREIGESKQELGGVMVTLAALSVIHNLDMIEEAENELDRVWSKIDKIRDKHNSKPKDVLSALPGNLKQ